MKVTDAEVAAEFDRAKEFLPQKPATVTFKQIVIAPQPTPAAKEVARVKAESLLVQLKAGARFRETRQARIDGPAHEGNRAAISAGRVAATTFPSSIVGCSAVRSSRPWRRVS